MANYGDLGFLANLLALPVEMGPQSQANYAQGAMNRRLLEGMKTFGTGGPQPMFSPEDINALAPQPAPPVSFPGLGVPVLGSILRGVGTTGRIIQGALGIQPEAPRLPTELLSAVVKQQGEQRKYDFGHHIAEDIRAGKSRSDIAAELAESGDVKGAMGLYGRGTHPQVTKWTTAAASMGLKSDPGEWTPQQAEAVYKKASASNAKPNHSEFATWLDTPDVVEDFWKKKADVAQKAAEGKASLKDLPPDVRKTMTDVDAVAKSFDRLMDLIDADPDVQAGRGVVEGRLRNYLYQAGLSQDGGENAFQAAQAQIGIIGALPFMRNMRRYEYLLDIRQHLPKPGDQLPLIRDKIMQWRDLALDMEEAALTYADTQRKDIPRLRQENEEKRTKLHGGGTPQGGATGGTTPGGRTWSVEPE